MDGFQRSNPLNFLQPPPVRTSAERRAACHSLVPSTQIFTARCRAAAARATPAAGGLAALCRALGTVALLSCAAASAASQDPATIDIAKEGVGGPPAAFEFAKSGRGELGRWTIVREPGAVDQVAIEHVSADATEDGFSLAIYRELSLKNIEFSVRFKSVIGTMHSAGLAVRVADPRNYYLVRASALDARVDLFRVIDGKIERIVGRDADVDTDHWQTLGLIAQDDRFTVSLDGQQLFTAWDPALEKEGRVALWTEEDNVTRFDAIRITALPWSAQPRRATEPQIGQLRNWGRNGKSAHHQGGK